MKSLKTYISMILLSMPQLMTASYHEDPAEEMANVVDFNYVQGVAQRVADAINFNHSINQMEDVVYITALYHRDMLLADLHAYRYEEDGCTILSRAAQKNNLSFIKFLLDIGMNPNIQDDITQMTALDWALKNKNQHAAEMLTKNKKIVA